jgi:hypothetical protein
MFHSRPSGVKIATTANLFSPLARSPKTSFTRTLTFPHPGVRFFNGCENGHGGLQVRWERNPQLPMPVRLGPHGAGRWLQIQWGFFRHFSPRRFRRRPALIPDPFRVPESGSPR